MAVANDRGPAMFNARPTRAARSGQTPRQFSEQMLLVAAVSSCVLAPIAELLTAPAGFRFAAVLVLFCVAPGVAVLPLLAARLEFGLVVATSLGGVLLAAQAMLWLHVWHPKPAIYVMAISCFAVIVYQERRSRAAKRAAQRAGERSKRTRVFEPMWVTEVELSEPFADLVAPVRSDGSKYRRSRVLVRLHRQPVGFVETALFDGELAADVLRRTILAALREPLEAHLANDGLSDVELDADEIPTIVAPACAAPGEHVPATPPASVVIATHNRPESLLRTLQALLEVDYPDFEVIVVDNASPNDGTEQVVRELADARLRFLREPRPGASRARNRGVREAGGDMIAFTDDDVIVDRDWLRGLAAGFTRAPRVGCVTGLVPSAELETASQAFFDRRVSAGGTCQRRIYSFGDDVPDDPFYPYHAARFGTGANWAASREALREVGPFDERLGPGTPTKAAEDLDYFLRVLLAGFSLTYEPSGLAWHVHRRDAKAARAQIFGYGRGLSAYACKHLFSRRTGVDMLRRTPGAIARLGGAIGEDTRDASTPRGLASAELLGFLTGPWAWVRSQWTVESDGTAARKQPREKKRGPFGGRARRGRVRGERASRAQRRVDAESGNGARSTLAQIPRRGRRRGMTVAVLGIDGAGKSTLIHELRSRSPIPTRSIYMGLWKQGGFLDRSPVLRPLRISARPLIALRRYLIGRWHRALGRLVLFDRYTYDPYEAPTPPLAPVKRAYMHFLSVICPAPDLILLLDVPADVAVARKQEEEPGDLAKKRELFLGLSTQLPNVHVIDAKRPLDDVVAESFEHIWRAYLGRGRKVAVPAEHDAESPLPAAAQGRALLRTRPAQIVRRARGTNLVSRVRAALPSILSDPAIESAGLDLNTQSVRRTESGVVIATLNAIEGETTAVVKIATTPGGARSLRAETDVLASLAQDARVAHLRKVLPTVLSIGEAGPYLYVAESGLPGVPGEPMIRDQVLHDKMLGAAWSIADDLHTATASDTVVGDEVINKWIRTPVESITHALERGDPEAVRALPRLRRRLETALLGREVRTSWIHGDFWPGNLLLAADASRVTGVVDWDRARPAHASLVDNLHLTLYTRALGEGRDLGVVIREELLASRNVADTDGDVSRALVLVYWLHHVVGNFERSDAYANNRRWVRMNVYPMLNL